MTQKYSLHRGQMGMFIATFPDGKQYCGSLESIRKMFDEPEPLRNVFQFHSNISFTTTSTAQWIPTRNVYGGSNGL